MKILAISDQEIPAIYSPRIREHFGDVDIIIGCGDLPYYYLEFVLTTLNVPLYYVPGNHDQQQLMSDGRVVSYAEGGIEIDGRVAHQDGLILAGLGGSMRYRPNSHNQHTEYEMRWRALKLVPRLVLNRLIRERYLDILLTHAPANGIHDLPDRAHNGFRTFNWFMTRFRPRFLLHGHVHNYRRDKPRRTWYKQTEVINVHPYKLIEWERETLASPGKHQR